MFSSSELPRILHAPRMGSFHGAEHLSEWVQILFITRNHFAFLGYTGKGAHAARRGGDRAAAAGPVPQPCPTWEWAPPSLLVHVPGSCTFPLAWGISLWEQRKSSLNLENPWADQKGNQWLQEKRLSTLSRENGADTALMYQVHVLA